jgi:hypothetical protein
MKNLIYSSLLILASCSNSEQSEKDKMIQDKQDSITTETEKLQHEMDSIDRIADSIRDARELKKF